MYTKVLSISVLFLLSLTYVYAGEEVKNTEKSPSVDVQSYNFNMSVDYKDGQIYLNWSPYNDRANFKWYKLAFSRENSRPLYPTDTNNFVGDVVAESSYSFWPNTADYIYVNLCVVTQNDTVYCDSGKKVLLPKINTKETPKIEAKDVSKDTTKQDNNARLEALRVQAQQKKEAEKVKIESRQADKTVKAETQKEVKSQDREVYTKEAQVRLSTHLQKRADRLIEGLILQLGTLNLSTTQEIYRIEQIQERLDRLTNQVRYRQLAKYIIQELERYKQDLESGFSEIEEIFRDFR